MWCCRVCGVYRGVGEMVMYAMMDIVVVAVRMGASGSDNRG